MKVWNVTEEQVREAAKAAGVAIHGDYFGNGISRTGKTERSALQFRLGLGTERIEDGCMERERNEAGRLLPAKPHPIRFQRRSPNVWSNSERRIASVCWHGHYAFMRFLFELVPNARVKTAFADYRGLQNFLHEAPTTGYINVGSMMYPVQARESCFCADYAEDDISALDRQAEDWFAATYPDEAEKRTTSEERLQPVRLEW